MPATTKLLNELLGELPEDLAKQVFTHASWTERRSDSYARLAFLGDSVLALAVTTHLYPRLEAERFGAGRLTKIRAQAVSGPSCRVVAERLRVPERLAAAAPAGLEASATAHLATERVLASVIEAVIGACYLQAGYERTAQAVVQAFAPEIEEALENPVELQVNPAGAARATGRYGGVCGDERGGTSARKDFRGGGEGGWACARLWQWAQQEARRAGGRARGRRSPAGGVMGAASTTGGARC